MINLRRCLLVASMAFAVAISSSAQAANSTTMANVLQDGYVDIGSQVAAAESFAAVAGIGARRATASLVDSSRGQLLQFMSQENLAGYYAAGDVATTAFLDAAYAELTDTTDAARAARDLNILNGTYATAGANVGLRTAQSIGNAIQDRQVALRAERDCLSRFCDNSTAIRMNENAANRIWATPFYSYHDMDNKDGYSGYDL